MAAYEYVADEVLTYPQLVASDGTVGAYTLGKGDVIEAVENPDPTRFIDAAKGAVAVDPDASRVRPVDAPTGTPDTDTPAAVPTPSADVVDPAPAP